MPRQFLVTHPDLYWAEIHIIQTRQGSDRVELSETVATIHHIAGDHFSLRLQNARLLPEELLTLHDLLKQRWPAAQWRSW